MKKILLSLLCAVGLLSPSLVRSQSFTVANDTMITTANGGMINMNNFVTPVGGPVTLQWRAIESNLPSDWTPNVGICDNVNCYILSSLYPSGTLKTTASYTALGDFHIQVDLSPSTTLGTYYFKLRLHNQAISTDTAVETYIISKTNPTAAAYVTKSTDNVVLYPNPANNELNVVYDASADVKNIAVYNIIGKAMTIYRVNGTSANLNLENIPSGIYFVRLINSRGDVVVTRKFTKQ